MNEHKQRRWTDLPSVTPFDRVRRWLVAILPFLAAVAVMTIVWGVVVLIITGLKTQDTVTDLAEDAKQQAQRNAELLLLDCDLTTGKPIPVNGNSYRNDQSVLEAQCLHRKQAAERVSGYINTIKEGVGEQIQTSEDNIMSRLDVILAEIRKRPPPTVVRVPIPMPIRTTTTTRPRITTTTRLQPSTTTRTFVTTTTCPKKGKKHCV